MPVAKAVDHKFVSHQEWVKTRTAFLKREEYFSEGENGKVTLAELFTGRNADFNYDNGVSSTKQQLDKGELPYDDATLRESSDQKPERGPICACRRNAASSHSAVPARRLAQRSSSAASWALPSLGLALVPKCPMCIAAYLALGGGLGVSLSTASHLRIALLWLCWGALALLTVRVAVRFAKTRMMARAGAASWEALRNAWRYIPRLPAQGAAFQSIASSISLRGTMYGYIKQGHRSRI